MTRRVRPYEVLVNGLRDSAGTFATEAPAVKRAEDYMAGRWPMARGDSGRMTSYPPVAMRADVALRGPGFQRRWVQQPDGTWLETRTARS